MTFEGLAPKPATLKALGQITGAQIAAQWIGIIRALAVYAAPEVEVAVPYIIMVLVLIIRPHGLFTVAQARRI
ncbi:hypothetical protein G6F51_014796 [Rhizopus arrhizus]|uniref:Uncharacterized protein n=1 Tax=Rhizopus oryzae TaxID=64495 RepID=A0A9P7BY66_RHIOR|nr:hypothetical protein G6F51_014796 [Rhizopus arrhizus]